jgi:hypothetical protein
MPAGLLTYCHSSFMIHDNGKTTHAATHVESLSKSPAIRSFARPVAYSLNPWEQVVECHPSPISEELPSPLVILFLGLRKTYRLRTRDHFGPVIMKYFLSSLGLG